MSDRNSRHRQIPQFVKSGDNVMKHKWILASLLLPALFLGVGRNALASTTRYVDGSRGSDHYSGTSLTTAFKTIQRAIAVSSPGDAIVVAPATYRENLVIAKSLTIVGSGTQTTVIDGGHSGPVVTINGANVGLGGFTVRNGSSHSHGGGGIYNIGTLTITKITVSGNTSDDSLTAAGGLGGGIYNAGTLTMSQSTVSGNTALRYRTGSVATGGGIYNKGKLTITNSTLSANQAMAFWPAGVPYGGGIANDNGTAIISNSTLSQNSALIHTPFGTAGTYGGGIYNHGAGIATFQNSIVANNTQGGNCKGTVNSRGHNLSSDGTCTFNGAGDQKNINARLGALHYNGGPTETMALLGGSPAIDAGNPSGCNDPSGHRLMVDQRGHSRPKSGACDMGAYNH
jgi:hypothetical protein